jgi:hypothetical protein
VLRRRIGQPEKNGGMIRDQTEERRRSHARSSAVHFPRSDCRLQTFSEGFRPLRVTPETRFRQNPADIDRALLDEHKAQATARGTRRTGGPTRSKAGGKTADRAEADLSRSVQALKGNHSFKGVSRPVRTRASWGSRFCDAIKATAVKRRQGISPSYARASWSSRFCQAPTARERQGANTSSLRRKDPPRHVLHQEGPTQRQMSEPWRHVDGA